MQRIGAIVEITNLAQLRLRDREQIAQKLFQHKVLVVPGQRLSPAEQIQFSSQFGPPIRSMPLAEPPSWAAVAIEGKEREFTIEKASLVHRISGWHLQLTGIKNRAEGVSLPPIVLGAIPHESEIDDMDTIVDSGGHTKDYADVWHSDLSFCERPPKICVLFGDEIPSDGIGDTLFCDMSLALTVFSEEYKGMLRRLSASHVADAYTRTHRVGIGRRPRLPAIPAAVNHPIIRRIPETGEETLFVNPYYTETISGMTVEESKPILELIWSAAVRPEFIYRHRWENGDVVIWDNRSTMHYGCKNIFNNEYRRLTRTMSMGEIPVPAL